MPKKAKASKIKRRKVGMTQSRPLLLKDDQEQVYAKVQRNLGDKRFECYCYDGVTRSGRTRGKIRKFTRINAGDTVLIALRYFQGDTPDDKADILHVYKPDEVKKLEKMGHLPPEQDEIQDEIVFCDEEEVKEDFIFDEI